MPKLPAIDVSDAQKTRIYKAFKTKHGLKNDTEANDALMATMISAVNAVVTQVEADELKASMNQELQGKLNNLPEGLPLAPKVEGSSLPPGPPLNAADRARAQVAELHLSNGASPSDIVGPPNVSTPTPGKKA